MPGWGCGMGRSERELKVSREAEDSALVRGRGRKANREGGRARSWRARSSERSVCFILREAGATLQSFQSGSVRVRLTPLPPQGDVPSVQQVGAAVAAASQVEDCRPLLFWGGQELTLQLLGRKEGGEDPRERQAYRPRQGAFGRLTEKCAHCGHTRTGLPWLRVRWGPCLCSTGNGA